MSKPPRLTLPPAARAYRLTTDRGAFAVHEAGEPVLGTALLLPGFTGSKEDFIALLEPLAAAGFRVLAVDGRGQYQTPGPREESAYGLQELGRDVLAQAAAAGGGPLHLVGHSLGGLVARAAVLRDASPFASLTLMSSGPGAIAEEQRARTKLLVAALEAMREDMPGVWEAMRAHDPEDAVPDAPELARFLRERWLGTVPEQLIATGRVLISEPDRVAELAEVPLPKLVLSGTVDYAWPVPLMDEMAVRLGASRVLVEAAEHSPNAENPQVTADSLVRFWRSLSAR
ncbi:alpha/beta fold hydrolase [Streptomyces lavendulae]|uniref:Short chain dehydrogenase n=1 Tax=Streptomyces lavendulae subsp. lavendulae TaxID=58340 RepID=A0A2K8PDQ9_STRLA|nr:alpha/beta fold hydrolase [Streptomyces lavendulae]ATZ24618.1 short chain dehydrogenase [Streptomyces lavendulae subsp. lavendulae]QUQ54448.1 2-succinyl-6-hydroxy-2,4-cyclohexadiene-1-carboxylate synthase [Streptomyces lavendulae subsp. lavendulae]GLV99543.1 alpha/beta hydrolase [Streptomyces lavendulae subsp. lavendulae]